MWLITTLLVTVIVTILWFILPRFYRLDLLSLMLWSASFMILVDHIFNYDEGSFVEMETSGLITNSIVLGIVMLIPVFVIWITVLIIKKPKQNIEWR